MNLKQPLNPNYAATVVALNQFVELAGCDNIKGALIFGNHVIVGKDSKAGDIGLFFPVETQLDAEFLANNNLYRKNAQTQLSHNIDPDKSGFFDQHGRIKAVKFRGHKSEGFFIPLSSVEYAGFYDDDLGVGETFDQLDGHTICRKYVPKRNPGRLPHNMPRKKHLSDQIVDNQFRLHFDTANLRRNIHEIHPDDYISISDKWHGTSVVISKVLTKRKLPWYERLLKLIGVKVQEQEYGLVYSSRKVIKAVNGVANPRAKNYYTEDIWGVVAKEVEDKIPLGFTLYGEIVGYTPDGSPIQGGYHYGCPVGGHKFLVYRVTSTNADGKTLELTWNQMKEFCTKYGLEMVRELWYGRAGDLLDGWATNDGKTWDENFLSALESMFVHDQMCEHNRFEVPAEGVVVRIDGMEECRSWKLKSFKFLEAESKALDKGAMDIETEQSETLEEAA